MFLRTKKKVYEFNLGLKGLILLSQNTNLAEDDIPFFLYCGLIRSHPSITFNEIDEIIQECELSAILSYCYSPLSLNEIGELYTKAVGEVGIAPADFYNMTVEEIDLAYEGYLRRKETEANLVKIAILTRADKDLIRLTEDKGYQVGSLTERARVFKTLDIQDEEEKYGL